MIADQQIHAFWDWFATIATELGADLRNQGLLDFPDGALGIIVEANNLPRATQDERETAASIVLDGLLGEARRLETIVDIECVTKLARDSNAGATHIQHLANHLAQLSQS